MYWSLILLRNRDAFWDAIRDRELRWRHVLGLVFFVVIACGLYGTILAGWRSPRLTAYVAIKLPLLFLGAAMVVAVFNWMTASIAGAGLSFRVTVAVVFASMVIGCWILLGLAPVAWLFAVSTQSIFFIVILALMLWLVAVSFAARYVGKLRAHPLFERQGGIKLWFLILVIVTLQMTTCMRPMLAKPTTGWWTGQKQFFLSHFSSVL